MNSFLSAPWAVKISSTILCFNAICCCAVQEADKKRSIGTSRIIRHDHLLGMGYNPFALMALSMVRDLPTVGTRYVSTKKITTECDKKSWESRSPSLRRSSLQSLSSTLEMPPVLERTSSAPQATSTAITPKLSRQRSTPINIPKPPAQRIHYSHSAEEELSRYELRNCTKFQPAGGAVVRNEPQHKPPLEQLPNTPTDRIVPPQGMFLMDWPSQEQIKNNKK